MSTRRRSDRYVMEVPVWLKDAQGGDRTVTADVSAHGIAVVTTKARPARQYVELELSLPSPLSKINVTAIVARQINNLETKTGRVGVGLGLDFFLLDSRAKQEWQRFIASLAARAEVLVQPLDGAALPVARQIPKPAARSAPEPSASSPVPEPRATSAPAALSAPILPSPPPPPDGREAQEGTPTYIIKPRDLGRLWAFFRGEMSKGVVRIETPVPLAEGAAAELLVVHPETEAEWTLLGRVVRSTSPANGGQIILQIALEDGGGEARSAFRNFVASGQGMIEEDVALSVDIHDLDPDYGRSKGALSVVEGASPGQDLCEAIGVEDVVSSSVTDIGITAMSIEDAPLLDVDGGALIDLGDEPLRPTDVTEAMSLDAVAQNGLTADFPTESLPEPPILDAPELRRAAPAEIPALRSVPALPERAASDRAPDEDRVSGRVFSSFFFEAEAAKPKPAQSSARSKRVRPGSGARLVDLKSVVPLPMSPRLADTVALLYAQTSDLASSSDPMAFMDAAPPAGEPAGNGQEPDATEGGRARSSTPGGASGAPAARQDAHLTREISVARSRLMRSPNSVTACYRLGMLLMRGRDEKQLEEALSTLQRVTQLEPNHPGAHHALADMLWRRGEIETAAEHLHRAKRLGYQINPDLERHIAEARALEHD